MPFWFKRLHITTNQFQSWYFTILVIVANGIKHFCLVQYSCSRTTIDHLRCIYTTYRTPQGPVISFVQK